MNYNLKILTPPTIWMWKTLNNFILALILRYFQISGLFNISAINILWAMIGGTRLSYDDKNFKILLIHLERLFRQGNLNGGIINGVPGLRKVISIFYEMDDDRTDRMLHEFFKVSERF